MAHTLAWPPCAPLVGRAAVRPCGKLRLGLAAVPCRLTAVLSRSYSCLCWRFALGQTSPRIAPGCARTAVLVRPRGRSPLCRPPRRRPPRGAAFLYAPLFLLPAPCNRAGSFPCVAAPALVRARCGHPHPCAVRTPPTAPRPARPRRPPPGAGPRPPRVRAPLSGARLQALLQGAAGRPRTAKPSCPSDAAPRRARDRRTAHRRRLQQRRRPRRPIAIYFRPFSN